MQSSGDQMGHTSRNKRGKPTPHNRWRKKTLYSYKKFIETTNPRKMQTANEPITTARTACRHFALKSHGMTHYGNCIDHDFVKVEMPCKEEDKWVQYHDGQTLLKVPFIMYADFREYTRTHGKEQQRAN